MRRRRTPELTTDRLRIRPFTADDFDGAHRALDIDQEEPGMSREERQAAIAYRITQLDWDGGIGCYAIETRDSRDLIGYVGLQFHLLPGDPASPEVELFYKLGRSWWGRGYATEAGRAMLALAFDVLMLRRTVSVTERGNHRSIALLRRLGATISDHPARSDLVIGVIEASHRPATG